MPKPFSFTEWQARHIDRIESFVGQIDALYQTAVAEAARLATRLPIDPKRPFSFSDYPQAQGQFNTILQNLTTGMQTTVARGTAEAWNDAGAKNDAMMAHLLGTGQLSQRLASQYTGARNDEARAAFQTRSTAGLNLSQRVFKYEGQFRKELELGLDVGLAAGQSAAKLSQSIRQYLQNPDQLFRRVRNQRGQLVLSRAAQAVNPGRGVYRSSYKNAMRLTRTEINQAYREADALRYQAMPFVVGIEVRRSNRGGVCDVCDRLKGTYPKNFVFRGWHPQCRCNAVSVLATEKEMEKLTEMVLAGEPLDSFRSVNEITQPNQGWKEWVAQNRERMSQGTTPQFVQQNTAFVPPAPLPPPVPAVDPATRFAADGFTIGLPADFNRLYNEIAPTLDISRLNQEVTDIVTRQGIAITERRLKVFESQFQVYFSGHHNGEAFNLQRSFYRRNGQLYVDHDLFTVPKPLQSKGMSREVFQSLYSHYQEIGVDMIRVHANIDVGGYAWAQYGFTFEYQPDRRMVYNRALQKLDKKQMATFRTVWDVVKEEPIFPLHAISAIPEVGKKILLNSDWNGILDLTDPRQRSLFERYLFRK